jgi:hypothetical protein
VAAPILCPQALSAELNAIAYHEAGHVVVGMRLGLEVLDTDIEPDDEGGRGHTHFAPADASDRESVSRVVTTFMAGFAAETKLGAPDPEGSGFDMDLSLRDWLARLEPDPKRRPELAQEHFARAMAILDDSSAWGAVEAVATELLSHSRLDGTRAREVTQTSYRR